MYGESISQTTGDKKALQEIRFDLKRISSEMNDSELVIRNGMTGVWIHNDMNFIMSYAAIANYKELNGIEIDRTELFVTCCNNIAICGNVIYFMEYPILYRDKYDEEHFIYKSFSIDVSNYIKKDIDNDYPISWVFCKCYDICDETKHLSSETPLSLLAELYSVICACISICQCEYNNKKIRKLTSKHTRSLNVRLSPYGITTEMTERDWIFFYKDTSITLEEAIKRIPDDDLLRIPGKATTPSQSQLKLSTPSITQKAPTPPPKPPKTMLLKLEAPIGIMTSAGIPRMYNEVFISGNTAVFGVGGDNCIRVDVSKAQVSTVSHEPDNCDTFNVKYNSLLNVVLTTIGTCISIWKGMLPYDTKDMCNSLTAQMNPYFQQYGIRTELTGNQWRFFYKGSQITLEDALKEIPINAPFELAKTSSVLDMSSATWHLRDMEMKQELGAPSYSVVPEGTSFFTSSSYICPTCGKFISKALINQSVINVDGSKKPIDKVFTCKYCKEFFAPIFDHPLSSGSLYHLEADDESYKSIVKQMDSCGRRSLF